MLQTIELSQLDIDFFNSINKDYFLVTAFDKDKRVNTMTCGWGTVGVLYNKPVFQVYVRDSRYTYDLLENCDGFTTSFFPPGYKKDLMHLGRVSGRSGDKLAQTNLNYKPLGESRYSFEEANLIFSCTLAMKTRINEKDFIDSSIKDHYPLKDYHTIYTGYIDKVYINNEEE